ncbi:MAG: hypothetical protein KF883_14635 [Thermomicrobiales bacterium]|nr:hypothetical protein [Thermomicrobiales bacterium]
MLRVEPGARGNDRGAAHLGQYDGPGNPLFELPTASGDDETPARSIPFRELSIRQAGLRDLLNIRSVDLTYRLNQPESMLANRNPLGRVAQVVTARGERKPVVLLAEAQGHLLGYSEFRPCMPDLRWHLWTIGLVNVSDDPQPIWAPLLEEGTRFAGAAGVKRLYARAPVDSPVGDSLRRAGYAPYARERVYSTAGFRAQPSDLRFREQERTDTWAVHQLYNHSVPREVVNIEAYTSHRWELAEGRSEETGAVRAWIHEGSEGPVVYVRSESARRRQVLDVIYAPGRARDAASMIDALMTSRRLGPHDGEMYLAVRGYNSELETFLTARGFGLWLEQELYIRYTTAPLRVQTADAVLHDAEALERRPKHVPAYYTGSDSRNHAKQTLHALNERSPAGFAVRPAHPAVE